jgi:hypothetical protein
MKFTLPVAQPFEQDTLDDAQFSFGASLSLCLPLPALFG